MAKTPIKRHGRLLLAGVAGATLLGQAVGAGEISPIAPAWRTAAQALVPMASRNFQSDETSMRIRLAPTGSSQSRTAIVARDRSAIADLGKNTVVSGPVNSLVASDTPPLEGASPLVDAPADHAATHTVNFPMTGRDAAGSPDTAPVEHTARIALAAPIRQPVAGLPASVVLRDKSAVSSAAAPRPSQGVVKPAPKPVPRQPVLSADDDNNVDRLAVPTPAPGLARAKREGSLAAQQTAPASPVPRAPSQQSTERLAPPAAELASLADVKIRRGFHAGLDARVDIAQIAPRPLRTTAYVAQIAPAPHQGRMAVRLDGSDVGKVPFRMDRTNQIHIQIAQILDVLSDRFEPAEFERLRSSGTSDSYVTLAELQSAGIVVEYDPVYDEIVFGEKG